MTGTQGREMEMLDKYGTVGFSGWCGATQTELMDFMRMRQGRLHHCCVGKRFYLSNDVPVYLSDKPLCPVVGCLITPIHGSHDYCQTHKRVV